MHNAAISVDLGSAYTKVGIRRGFDTSATLASATSISLDDEENYLIPSVVARVETRGTKRWLIGSHASAQKPGDGVTFFPYWKASLFAEGGAISRTDAAHIAEVFFRELLSALLERIPHVRQLPVRIAIPAFNPSGTEDAMIKEIVQRAGWRSVATRTTVSEPEANAIGLWSRGRNSTWTPPRQSHRGPPNRSIRMQDMLEAGLRSAFRTMKDKHRILVTDVGAFTTDFGYVEFDSGFRDDDWNRPRTIQKSVELGIRQLDDRVRQLLPSNITTHFASRPVIEWERAKRQLYHGNSHRMVINGQKVDLGAGTAGENIQSEIFRFAESVLEARVQFCKEHGLGPIDEEAVTGGGSAIPALRQHLVSYATSTRHRVLDLWDPREPEHAVANGAGPMTPREKDARRFVNHQLVRCASALGAASVFFG